MVCLIGHLEPPRPRGCPSSSPPSSAKRLSAFILFASHRRHRAPQLSGSWKRGCQVRAIYLQASQPWQCWEDDSTRQADAATLPIPLHGGTIQTDVETIMSQCFMQIQSSARGIIATPFIGKHSQPVPTIHQGRRLPRSSDVWERQTQTQ